MALSVGHWEATHPTKRSKHSHKRSPWKHPRERTQEAPKPADAAHVERSGVRRTVRCDQPNGPALSRPRGQRHSPAPGRKRRTVRRRAPDGPTNVGQQGPSTAKQAHANASVRRSGMWCRTVRRASDGQAYYAGWSGVYENARPSPRQPPGKSKSNQTSPNEPQSSPNLEDTE